jgi:hypothetical protein
MSTSAYYPTSLSDEQWSVPQSVKTCRGWKGVACWFCHEFCARFCYSRTSTWYGDGTVPKTILMGNCLTIFFCYLTLSMLETMLYGTLLVISMTRGG